ncbi:cytochrome P450 4V2 isoform X2 [Parasteatoda tepidariorum]|uniref:cytochrome P450 4V2 isoform X2 n=1 Tax=Parasteatoda tepidariorum TaxID=114398 RepID=UPI001C720503|nr:cytochrome P450 4V2 isoform X2 [Parasteatoda tepidariorum]
MFGILNHSTEIKKAWFYDFLHPWLGFGLLTSHGEKWRHRRKQLTPAFHFSILKDFQPIFNKQSKILADILDKHTHDDFIDIVPFITLCSLDVICESILGKELNSQTQPSHPYSQAVHGLTGAVFERMRSPWLWFDSLFSILPFGKKFAKNKSILHEFTNQMIAEKKHKKIRLKNSNSPLNINCADDDIQYKRKKRALLDLLLDELIDNDSITEDEIREEVDTFTFEGHDTTSMSMNWTLYLIGLHPWIQEKLHNELDMIFGEEDRDPTDEDLKNMKYLECVIKEALRLYPSVPAYGREVTEDLDCNGFIIPKGSTCLVNAYILHRDSEYFPNPEKFDPERFSSENITGRHPFAYVPFSAGPRNCIGQKFALMEEKTILSTILRRFKVRSLDARDQVHLINELVLRPYKGLRIQIRQRHQDFDFHLIYYRA